MIPVIKEEVNGMHANQGFQNLWWQMIQYLQLGHTKRGKGSGPRGKVKVKWKNKGKSIKLNWLISQICSIYISEFNHLNPAILQLLLSPVTLQGSSWTTHTECLFKVLSRSMVYRTVMLKAEYWIKLSAPLFLLHSLPFVFQTEGGKRTKPKNLAQNSCTMALHRGVTAETDISIYTYAREQFLSDCSSVAVNLAIAEEGPEIAHLLQWALRDPDVLAAEEWYS